MWSYSSSRAASPLTPRSLSSQFSPRIKHVGRQMAQIIALRPGCVEEYLQSPHIAWPAVFKHMKDCNLEDYTIFHDAATHSLFTSFRYVGYDWAGDVERLRESAVIQAWWKVTRHYQASPDCEMREKADDGVPEWWQGIERAPFQP
ncbi:unnamed protein product [Blumeria hordei]|uniref:DUF718 domain protein n=2 Tax=Blumeria hordei TaxID=2867405 RepID=A0A383UJP7_BLUHO|nr:DUF718 domain-containing protein [Blumeria hordei DH14]SZF00544.1 unnamed protein product [Blumeria hordei]